MLDHDDLAFIEEPPVDDVSDLLRALPEIRRRASHPRRDEGLGLHSLLERPEAQSKAWWRSVAAARRAA